MSTTETKLIRKLIKKYGKDTSLGEVLKLENNINIENVNFKLLGVYKYAYEMTGESFSIEGTIKDIIWYDFGGEVMKDSVKTPLVEAITKENLHELALFFIGQRDEGHRDFINVSSSRKVTVEEVEAYLKTLYVNEDFEYKDTIEEF